MTSKIIEQPAEKKATYPVLKKLRWSGTTLIVAFSNKNTGTVLHSSDSDHKFGDFARDWDESVFEPFHDKLELSN